MSHTAAHLNTQSFPRASSMKHYFSLLLQPPAGTSVLESDTWRHWAPLTPSHRLPTWVEDVGCEPHSAQLKPRAERCLHSTASHLPSETRSCDPQVLLVDDTSGLMTFLIQMMQAQQLTSSWTQAEHGHSPQSKWPHCLTLFPSFQTPAFPRLFAGNRGKVSLDHCDDEGNWPLLNPSVL